MTAKTDLLHGLIGRRVSLRMELRRIKEKTKKLEFAFFERIQELQELEETITSLKEEIAGETTKEEGNDNETTGPKDGRV